MSASCPGGGRFVRAMVIVVCASATVTTSTTAFADDVSTSKSFDHVQVSKRRAQNLGLTLGALGLLAASNTVLKPYLTPTQCRWCGTPSIDANVRNALVWDNTERANMLSNVTAHGLIPAASVGLLALGSIQAAGTDNLFDDLLPIVESVAFSQLAVQAFKFSFGRERPFLHYGGEAHGADDNMSFVSGHSALAFSLVTSAGMVAHERGYKYEPYIWAIGLPLAATTAYLRIAADKHYMTDVVAGSLIGATAGLLIPKLTKRLPFEIAPAPNGLSIVGQW